MASSESESYLVAPAWHAEEALERALARINEIRAAAKYPGVDDFQTATVGDYLRARPDGLHCRLGDLTHLSNAEKGVSSVNRNLCKRADCATCTPRWLKNQLQRAFANWDGQPLYRATVTSYEEWKNTRRGRRLRDRYAGRYLRLTIGYAGEQWIFFPGQAGEGDPVLDPAQEVLEALLLVPAYANGKRRTQLPKKVAGMRRPVDEAPDDLPDESRTILMQLPHYVSADVAERVCPNHGLHVNGLYQVSGCALANRVTGRITGREVKQTMPYWRGMHFASWTVTGLSPAEVDAVRAALEPLSEIYYAERAERRRKRQAAAPTPTWWKG